MRNTQFVLITALLTVISNIRMQAQTADTSLVHSLGELQKNVERLNKLKISGLVQFQYQLADTAGIRSFAGGDFPANSADRMMIRRGRLKVNYTGNLTQYVIMIQLTEAEFNVREAYMVLTDPWTNSFSLTNGVFFRPFGYELDYSDASREGAERTRMVQILFPGERDLGSMLQYAPAKRPLKFLNVKAGLFAGNGVAKETDKYKDLIGRAGFNIPIGLSSLSISGGISGYFGRQLKDASCNKDATVIAIDTSGSIYSTTVTKKYGASTFTYNEAAGTFSKTDSAKAIGVQRRYLGADLQMNYELARLGKFSLRAEYISGVHPGTSSSSKVYQKGSGDLYLRSFSGFYIWVVQNIGKKSQVYLKYDEYDPNVKVSGTDIGKSGSLTGAADMKYCTLGFGAAYNVDPNVKVSVYYDVVKNEHVPNLSGNYNRDLPDNVVTLRVQYKY